MKVCIPVAAGGHLSEALYLIEAFDGHDVFFMMSASTRARTLSYRTYLLPLSDGKPLVPRFSRLLPHMIRVLWRERPDIIFSTGAEIAVPAFYIGKLLGAKTVFVETVTHVHTPTLSGRLVYPVSDLFLVQHPQLLSRYGAKACYEGSVL